MSDAMPSREPPIRTRREWMIACARAAAAAGLAILTALLASRGPADCRHPQSSSCGACKLLSRCGLPRAAQRRRLPS